MLPAPFDTSFWELSASSKSLNGLLVLLVKEHLDIPTLEIPTDKGELLHRQDARAISYARAKMLGRV